jgi:hypothetical protein
MLIQSVDYVSTRDDEAIFCLKELCKIIIHIFLSEVTWLSVKERMIFEDDIRLSS